MCPGANLTKIIPDRHSPRLVSGDSRVCWADSINQHRSKNRSTGTISYFSVAITDAQRKKNQLKWREIYFASCSPRFQPSVGSVSLGLRWSRSIKSQEYVAKAARFLFRMQAETGKDQSQVLFCRICTSWSPSFNQALSLTMTITVNSTSWGRVERQGKYWRLEEKGLPLTLESSQSLWPAKKQEFQHTVINNS